jgi:hypothetical protein
MENSVASDVTPIAAPRAALPRTGDPLDYLLN